MIFLIFSLLRDLFRPRRDLLIENLALRQQIVVLRRTNPKPSSRGTEKAGGCGGVSRAGRRRSVAIDFLTVPTVLFRNLYVFVILSLDRRRIIHFNVTSHPTAEWTALQITQAFPFDTAPSFLIRDRDQLFGAVVEMAFTDLGIEQLVTAPRSPWQNGYCERMVGTLKRECLNHVIPLGENHTRRTIKLYLEYYHEARTHMGLEKDTPNHRQVEPPRCLRIFLKVRWVDLCVLNQS